jgi:hypothetical protein
VVPIPNEPTPLLPGAKTNLVLVAKEVLIPEETDENPINCGVVVVDNDIVFGTSPVKLLPSP